MRLLLGCPGCLGLALYLASVICLGALCVKGQESSSGKNSQVLRITIRTNPWNLSPSGQENTLSFTGNNANTQKAQDSGLGSSTAWLEGNPKVQQPRNSGDNQLYNNQQSSHQTWSALNIPGVQRAPIFFDLRNKDNVLNAPQPLPPSTEQQSGSVLNNDVANKPQQAEPNILSNQSLPESVRNPTLPRAPAADPVPVTPASAVLANNGQVDPRRVVWNRQQIQSQNMQKLAGPFDIWGAISRPPSTLPPAVLSRNEPTPSPNQRAFLEAIRNRFIDRERGIQTQGMQGVQPTKPPAQHLTQLPTRQTTRRPTTQSTQQWTQQPLRPLRPNENRRNQVYPVRQWTWGLGRSAQQQMWTNALSNQLENMPWLYRQHLLNNLGSDPFQTGLTGTSSVVDQGSSVSGQSTASNQTAPSANTGPLMTTANPIQPVAPSIFDRRRLSQMMYMSTYYERNCNQPIVMRGPLDAGLEMAPPLAQGPREPMACNCYPRRDCESVAFMYITPKTTRECGTRLTGYTCCCEDPRPIV